jgi:LacI family transcriptional regulator
MGQKPSITIQDVAKAAGVSVSTVSRVLNDKDDVAEATYEKVQHTIEEMGYTSNLAAKSLPLPSKFCLASTELSESLATT